MPKYVLTSRSDAQDAIQSAATWPELFKASHRALAPHRTGQWGDHREAAAGAARIWQACQFLLSCREADVATAQGRVERAFRQAKRLARALSAPLDGLSEGEHTLADCFMGILPELQTSDGMDALGPVAEKVSSLIERMASSTPPVFSFTPWHPDTRSQGSDSLDQLSEVFDTVRGNADEGWGALVQQADALTQALSFLKQTTHVPFTVGGPVHLVLTTHHGGPRTGCSALLQDDHDDDPSSTPILRFFEDPTVEIVTHEWAHVLDRMLARSKDPSLKNAREQWANAILRAPRGTEFAPVLAVLSLRVLQTPVKRAKTPLDFVRQHAEHLAMAYLKDHGQPNTRDLIVAQGRLPPSASESLHATLLLASNAPRGLTPGLLQTWAKPLVSSGTPAPPKALRWACWGFGVAKNGLSRETKATNGDKTSAFVLHGRRMDLEEHVAAVLNGKTPNSPYFGLPEELLARATEVALGTDHPRGHAEMFHPQGKERAVSTKACHEFFSRISAFPAVSGPVGAVGPLKITMPVQEKTHQARHRAP